MLFSSPSLHIGFSNLVGYLVVSNNSRRRWLQFSIIDSIAVATIDLFPMTQSIKCLYPNIVLTILLLA